MESVLRYEVGATQRTFTVRFADGEAVRDVLLALVREDRLRPSRLTGLGRLRNLRLHVFDVALQSSRIVSFDEEVSIKRMVGEVAFSEQGSALSVHLVLIAYDGSTASGYLLGANVAHELDVVLVES